MHPLRWIAFFGNALIMASVIGTLAAPGSGQPAHQPPLGSVEESANADKSKNPRANDFLIHGSVFTDKALAFPQAELRIRRSEEKKYRWRTLTNSRGDFAVRVPSGGQYQVLVHAKGFEDQHATVDAKGTAGEQNTVFRMVPVTGGKK